MDNCLESLISWLSGQYNCFTRLKCLLRKDRGKTVAMNWFLAFKRGRRSLSAARCLSIRTREAVMEKAPYDQWSFTPGLACDTRESSTPHGCKKAGRGTEHTQHTHCSTRDGIVWADAISVSLEGLSVMLEVRWRIVDTDTWHLMLV